jgi:hypothetical protein
VDAFAGLVVAATIVISMVMIALAPRFKRAQLRKQLDGTAGGSLAGLGSGFDAVWRPSAEDARADWEAQVELPAPAPNAGDKGRIRDGRLVIDLDDLRDQR